MRIERASSSPVEIRVPALNDFVHGLTGKVGATPGRSCGGALKKRIIGWKALAGDPGGRAS